MSVLFVWCFEASAEKTSDSASPERGQKADDAEYGYSHNPRQERLRQHVWGSNRWQSIAVAAQAEVWNLWGKSSISVDVNPRDQNQFSW